MLVNPRRGLGPLGDGAALRVNDEILQGILRNDGTQPVLLTFADGESVLLEADEEVVVGEHATCECWCTCNAGGTLKVFKFPCNGNDDDCDHNGERCTWTANGTTHLGTYQGCLKIWVLPAAN